MKSELETRLEEAEKEIEARWLVFTPCIDSYIRKEKEKHGKTSFAEFTKAMKSIAEDYGMQSLGMQALFGDGTIEKYDDEFYFVACGRFYEKEKEQETYLLLAKREQEPTNGVYELDFKTSKVIEADFPWYFDQT
ncbi:MAG: hypothetical protein KJ767_03840 [Nanoarchaeota archaeon]|nr:hypothetical protein [Nanoarchaeota archaeon]